MLAFALIGRSADAGSPLDIRVARRAWWSATKNMSECREVQNVGRDCRSLDVLQERRTGFSCQRTCLDRHHKRPEEATCTYKRCLPASLIYHNLFHFLSLPVSAPQNVSLPCTCIRLTPASPSFFPTKQFSALQAIRHSPRLLQRRCFTWTLTCSPSSSRVALDLWLVRLTPTSDLISCF